MYHRDLMWEFCGPKVTETDLVKFVLMKYFVTKKQKRFKQQPHKKAEWLSADQEFTEEAEITEEASE